LRIVCILFLLLFLGSLAAQSDSTHIIKVHFLYGSKPKCKHKDTEKKYFGGIHGGHVSIEVDGKDYGFEPTDYNVHIFAHRKRFKSHFVEKDLGGKGRYGTGSKTTTFIVPINNEQYKRLKNTLSGYCTITPYDYAFFGMRCASTAQDVLAQTGLVKERKRFRNIVTTFYPKKLRKRIFRLARKNNYQIIKQEGRPTRKWEKD